MMKPSSIERRMQATMYTSTLWMILDNPYKIACVVWSNMIYSCTPTFQSSASIPSPSPSPPYLQHNNPPFPSPHHANPVSLSVYPVRYMNRSRLPPPPECTSPTSPTHTSTLSSLISLHHAKRKTSIKMSHLFPSFSFPPPAHTTLILDIGTSELRIGYPGESLPRYLSPFLLLSVRTHSAY